MNYRYICLIAFLLPLKVEASEWFEGENLLTQPIPLENNYQAYTKKEDGWKSFLWLNKVSSGGDSYEVNIVAEKTANLEAFQESMDNPGREACKNFSSLVIDDSNRNGYHSIMWETECVVGGTHVHTIQLGISGNDSLYFLRKLWKVPVRDDEIALWKKTLSKVSLCDTRTSEHPCPEGFRKRDGTNLSQPLAPH